MTDLALEREAIALLDKALDLPEHEREAFLAERAGGKPSLLARVRAMLAVDRDLTIRTGAAAETVDEEEPPARIGAYRIEDRIGRGGMGSVYRGVRASGDFDHVVAIKIIKPGLLTEALIERFRHERQLLASLSHPHIAQLYDGGETANGTPYLVMEYVDGLPLLEWAAKRQPSLAERQRLFIEICAAVAFAHRSLIVHRDLTPSNVLVSRDDVVKLIDFGIAKPAQLEGTAPEPGSPSIGTLSLTPGYAAPERMTSRIVTTAADIYSLGKLLERLMPPEAGDRELRAIIARATAHDPLDRYSSAEALGGDVGAWRDDFPVAAVEGGRRYRLGRFVKRHRFGIGAAAFAGLLLIGAFALTAAAYTRAEAARRAEVARFEELRSLAHYMLFELNGRMARVAGNTEARATLADRAQVYLSALADSPKASDDLKQEAAQGFIALARAQGVPTQPNLGEIEQARGNLRRAIEMLRAVDRPPDVKAPDLVEGLTAFAMIQAHADSHVPDAARTLGEAAQLLDSVPAGQRQERWYGARRQLRHGQLEVAILGQQLPDLLRLAGLLETEIAEWPAGMQHSREAQFDRASAMYHRALHQYFTDAIEPAITTFQRAETRFAALDRAYPSDPEILYALMWNAYIGYGAADGEPGRSATTTHFLDLAIHNSDRLIAIEANDLSLRSFAGVLRQAQAEALSAAGEHVRAVSVQREVLGLYRSALGPERRAPALNKLALAEFTLGNIAKAAGDRALACASYGEARTDIAELTRRDALVATIGRYGAALEDNLRRCASGGPLSG